MSVAKTLQFKQIDARLFKAQCVRQRRKRRWLKPGGAKFCDQRVAFDLGAKPERGALLQIGKKIVIRAFVKRHVRAQPFRHKPRRVACRSIVSPGSPPRCPNYSSIIDYDKIER